MLDRPGLLEKSLFQAEFLAFFLVRNSSYISTGAKVRFLKVMNLSLATLIFVRARLDFGQSKKLRAHNPKGVLKSVSPVFKIFYGHRLSMCS